ncbi:hypothetical protein FEM48_Zijuj01G0173900 [Ziziphus jujuba var. spinosa]|uniref:Protein FAR1-RELATED SEQUENCE n=1 Tax=Ziziphus jujuba var. spinosa TaxID=714518 RepID=A0A978W2K3_ZIZJJ|nr:hypothetical protein FEM48_Zijuj01G0173900 [Ziziphus jujuba var. spinosa]
MSSAYFLSCTFEDDQSMLYSVQKAGGSGSSRNRQLDYNKFSDFVSCSCRLFNFNGIPCKHILVYFRIKQVMFLPSKYILRRWTKNAKIGEVWDNNGQAMNDQDDMSLVTRHASLSRAYSNLIDDASLTVEGTKFLLNEIELLCGKIKEMNGDGMLVPETNSKKSTQELPSISNPSHVRSKGCGKRFKSPKVMSISKSRLCRGCGLRRQQHDKRNYRRLQERSTMYDQDINSNLGSEDDDLTSHAGSNLHNAKTS